MNITRFVRHPIFARHDFLEYIARIDHDFAVRETGNHIVHEDVLTRNDGVRQNEFRVVVALAIANVIEIDLGLFELGLAMAMAIPEEIERSEVQDTL